MLPAILRLNYQFNGLNSMYVFTGLYDDEHGWMKVLVAQEKIQTKTFELMKLQSCSDIDRVMNYILVLYTQKTL